MNTERIASKGGIRISILSFSLLLFLFTLVPGKNVFDWRVVYRPSEGFLNPVYVDQFETFLEEMAEHGYNAVFLGGVAMNKIHTADAQAKERVHQMIAKSAKLGITIIPMAQGQTTPHSVDTSFVEAFPNIGTPFTVSGKTATVTVPPVSIGDPGFETPFGTRWKGAKFEQDTKVKRSGNASYRIDNPGKKSWFYQEIPVTPHRTYELSIYVKLSKDVSNLKDIGFMVVKGKRAILRKRDSNRNRIGGSAKGGGWVLHTDEFYSMECSSVSLFVVAAGAKSGSGSIWFDDVMVKEVGLYQTVQRETLSPIVVQSNDGAKVYLEGVDYTVGEQQLEILPGSSISGGEKLKVNWSTRATSIMRVPPTAFCGAGAWDVVRQQIRTEDEWFQTSPARLMIYSEWRVAGWDPACIEDFNIASKGCGPYFGHVARETENLYRAANSNREVLVFNDSFDPYHNSKPSYLVTNGGTFGSWTGLSEKTIVVNWNVFFRKESMRFFAGMDDSNWNGYGVKKVRQRQIISSGAGPNYWIDWLSKLDTLEKEGLSDDAVIGIAFQQYGFNANYDKIGAMADYCKDAGRWGTGPIQFPTAGIAPAENSVGSKSLSLSISLKSHAGIRRLHFAIPHTGHIELSVFNLSGRKVARILDETMSSHTYGTDLKITSFPAGIYFVRLTLDGKEGGHITKKLIVL